MIKPAVASASECETTTIFLKFQSTIAIRTTAKELVHPQTATPTRFDSTTTYDYIYDDLQQKKSKKFGMRLHWLRDRINNEQF